MRPLSATATPRDEQLLWVVVTREAGGLEDHSTVHGTAQDMRGGYSGARHSKIWAVLQTFSNESWLTLHLGTVHKPRRV